MPDTATRNIDAVIDGQLYIGKCVSTIQRYPMRKSPQHFR